MDRSSSPFSTTVNLRLIHPTPNSFIPNSKIPARNLQVNYPVQRTLIS